MPGAPAHRDSCARELWSSKNNKSQPEPEKLQSEPGKDSIKTWKTFNLNLKRLQSKPEKLKSKPNQVLIEAFLNVDKSFKFCLKPGRCVCVLQTPAHLGVYSRPAVSGQRVFRREHLKSLQINMKANNLFEKWKVGHMCFKICKTKPNISNCYVFRFQRTILNDYLMTHFFWISSIKILFYCACVCFFRVWTWRTWRFDNFSWRHFNFWWLSRTRNFRM